MRYRLRTLMIVLALGPPAMAGWGGFQYLVARLTKTCIVPRYVGTSGATQHSQVSTIQHFRHRPPMFRFTIRDVLWLMVVVGLSVGWFTDHRSTFALRAESAMLRGQLRDVVELAKEYGLHVTVAPGEVSIGGRDQVLPRQPSTENDP